MPSRRTHQKTRHGCLRCKQRKVKCDEGRPQCRNCLRHGAPCSYGIDSLPSPAYSGDALSTSGRTPGSWNGDQTRTGTPTNPPTSQAISTLNFLDLELMHHYSTVTCLTLTDKPFLQSVWQEAMPREALSHPFLMHGILALSALHIHQSAPASRQHIYREAAMTHQHIALASFTPTLKNITEGNCNALFAFSCVIAAMSFAFFQSSDSVNAMTDISGFLDVFDLLRGAATIVREGQHWIDQGSMGPLLRRENFSLNTESARKLELSEDVESALEALKQLNKTLLSSGDRPVVQDGIQSNEQPDVHAIYEKSIEELRNTFKRITIHPHDQGLALAWPIIASVSYLSLLRKQDPMALVIFAHYGVILHTMNKLWWLKGLGVRLMRAISEVLDLSWHGSMRWAIEKIEKIQGSAIGE